MNKLKYNIWQFKQNKPTLIVDDIIAEYPDIDRDFLYSVLMKRGVFKWLAVRRDLIKLKDQLKSISRELNRKKTLKEKGYHSAIDMCRKEIRKLCHSDRWRCPDIDNKAYTWMIHKENN